MRVLTLLGILCWPVLMAGQSSYDPLTPLKLNDGWEVQSSKNAGMDTRILEKLSNAIDSAFSKVHSTILVKKGKIVYEKYAGDYTHHDVHELRSISKFITTVLTGIAIDKGLINSSGTSLFEYIPEYQAAVYRFWSSYF